MRRRSFLVGAGGALLLGGAGLYGWRSSVGSMSDYASHINASRQPLPLDPTARDLVRYATLAANGHNTQPWRFRAENRAIDILPDFSSTLR